MPTTQFKCNQIILCVVFWNMLLAIFSSISYVCEHWTCRYNRIRIYRCFFSVVLRQVFGWFHLVIQVKIYCYSLLLILFHIAFCMRLNEQSRIVEDLLFYIAIDLIWWFDCSLQLLIEKKRKWLFRLVFCGV